MSDPTVEAARRAWVMDHPESSVVGLHYTFTQLNAAREALKPVREIVEDMRSIADHGAFIERDPYVYTEALEKAVFSTEELERRRK